MFEKKELGRMHIYCGDGKGKTTAAIGLSIRAAGAGMQVLFVQFLKSRDTSELNILNNINEITVLRSTEALPFTNQMNDTQIKKAKQGNNVLFLKAIQICESQQVDLLVFDEIMAAYHLNLIDTELVDTFLAGRDTNMELVLTGRDPAQRFLDMADYVSEIKAVKHPYSKGIKSRRGVEF